MADKTYPDLDEFDGLAGTELVALHQDGRLVRLTLAELAQWIKTAESIVPASEPFEGVLLERTGDLTGVTWPLMVPWQAAIYDTMGFWSGGAPTRITIPAGVSKVRLLGGAQLEAGVVTGSAFTSIYRNGSSEKFCLAKNDRQSNAGYSNNVVFSSTAVISVTPGDYFEFRINVSGLSGVDQVLNANSTFFALEVVEMDP